MKTKIEKTTKLNNGDVIVITDPRGVEMIAIFNRFGDNNTLFIYIQMNSLDEELYFNDVNWDFPYYLDKIQYRLATDLEKNRLYNALYRYFTEEYDYDWSNHFTDSSYFDILDSLLEVFCIKVNEDDDNFDYPEFMQEIRNYIWDRCCLVLGVSEEKITETIGAKIRNKLTPIVNLIELNKIMIGNNKCTDKQLQDLISQTLEVCEESIEWLKNIE
jgi:hypothetical protein